LVIEATSLRDLRLSWLAGQYNRAAYHAQKYPEPPSQARRASPEVQAEMDRIAARVKIKVDMERARNGR